jgi:hypothetical protein
MKFQHTITLVVTTEEDNPDMPSLNPRALAQSLCDFAEDQLLPRHPLSAIQSATVEVVDAKRTY